MTSNIIGLIGFHCAGKEQIVDALSELKVIGIRDEVIGMNFHDPIIRMLEQLGVPSEVRDDRLRWSENLRCLGWKSLDYLVAAMRYGFGPTEMCSSIWVDKLFVAAEKFNNQTCVIINDVRSEKEIHQLRLAKMPLVRMQMDDVPDNEDIADLLKYAAYTFKIQQDTAVEQVALDFMLFLQSHKLLR